MRVDLGHQIGGIADGYPVVHNPQVPALVHDAAVRKIINRDGGIGAIGPLSSVTSAGVPIHLPDRIIHRATDPKVVVGVQGQRARRMTHAATDQNAAILPRDLHDLVVHGHRDHTSCHGGSIDVRSIAPAAHPDIALDVHRGARRAVAPFSIPIDQVKGAKHFHGFGVDLRDRPIRGIRHPQERRLKKGQPRIHLKRACRVRIEPAHAARLPVLLGGKCPRLAIRRNITRIPITSIRT